MIEAIVAIATRKTGYHLRIALSSGPAARRLHPIENVLDEVVEHRGVELVDDLLTLALGAHQLGVAQLREVPRHGGPRRREVLGDLAGRARPVAQEPENLPSRRVGQCSEGVIHRQVSVAYLAKYVSVGSQVS